MEYMNNEENRKRWNSEQSHYEMKAVSSNYQEFGGFIINDHKNGIANKI